MLASIGLFMLDNNARVVSFMYTCSVVTLRSSSEMYCNFLTRDL